MVQVHGVELACYYKQNNPDAFTLVHFHGNGEAVADYVPWITDLYTELGLNLLLVEYRQYGGSSGKAQLVAMLGDGEGAMQAIGIPPSRAIVFGRSIGSLYAIELASRQPDIAGLVLDSGIADPCQRFLKYGELEAAGISEREVQEESIKYFDHHSKLSRYKNPLLILHTEHDGLIDISQAETNYQSAGSERKRFERFPKGNHNTILTVNLPRYFAVLREFIRECEDLAQ